MRQIFAFLYKYRAFGVFLVLEILSIWLLVTNNPIYGTRVFHSGNKVAGTVSQLTSEGVEYFELVEINQTLRKENESLQRQIRKLRSNPRNYLDSVGQYSVVGAKVINNTYRRSANYLTIATGTKDGIEAGMGVISANGVVGQVRAVSSNYASVYSILHPKLMISSKVKTTNTSCTVQWDRSDWEHAELKYLPRHVPLQRGDTILTSAYNSVFPPEVMVGTVEELVLTAEMSFYKARIRLSSDFTSLDYVFVIKDLWKEEKDSLLIL